MTSQKAVVVPTNSKTIVYGTTTLVTGNKAVSIPTKSGNIILKVNTLSVGDRALLIPTKGGNIVLAVKESLWEPYTYTLVATLPVQLLDMIVWDGYIYALAGAGYDKIYRSNDGTTWNLVATLTDVFSAAGFCIFGTDLYVVGSSVHIFWSSGAVWRSADGVTWSAPVEINPGGLGDFNSTGALCVFGGSLYAACYTIATAPFQQIYSSPDGTTWSLEATFTDAGNSSLNGLCVFGGEIYSGIPGYIWKSADGTDWTREADLTGQSVWIVYSLYVFDSKLWVGTEQLPAFSGNGKIFNSADGTNYTARKALTSEICCEMADLTKLYTPAGSHVYLTSNGTAWTTETATGTIVSIVVFGGYIYIGTTAGGIYKRT